MNEETVSHKFTTEDNLTMTFGFMRKLVLTSENPVVVCFLI